MELSNTLHFLAAVGLLVNSAPGANLIKNVSFEKPVVVAGTYQLLANNETFSGWKVIGATGDVSLVSGTFTQGGFTFPPAGGSQWLDLTGNSNTATGVQQTVATTGEP
jgi:hypothetical protein